MGLFKKKLSEKKLFEKKMVTVQKFRPVFSTVDGNTHIGLDYKYGIANRLICSIPEYLMIDIKSDGYLEDHRKVMYPLTNIVSIDWQLVDEKEVEDKFWEYQIFVTTKELEEK